MTAKEAYQSVISTFTAKFSHLTIAANSCRLVIDSKRLNGNWGHQSGSLYVFLVDKESMPICKFRFSCHELPAHYDWRTKGMEILHSEIPGQPDEKVKISPYITVTKPKQVQVNGNIEEVIAYFESAANAIK